jgi:sugar lactone lactonase YvrE
VPQSTRRKVALVAGISAAVLAAAALLWWWRLPPPGPPPLEEHWAATVRTIAGGPALSEPFGIALGSDGAVFVADGGDAHRISRIAADGRVDTVAGGTRGFADGQGAAARFDTPAGLAIDASGVLFVADTGNHAVRRITPDGVVSTLAGDGLAGSEDGAAARFDGPVGIAVDRGGRVIVADTYNDRIRAISREGIVTTLAGGSEPGPEDGMGGDARFDTPCGVCLDDADNIYVADTGNNAIRRIDSSGNVTTVARDMGTSPVRPIGIACTNDKRLSVTDERGRVLEVDAGGQSRTVAGGLNGFHDGTDTDARFRRLAGIAGAGPGRLVVADAGNALVRTITAVSQSRAAVPWSPLAVPHFDEDLFALTPLLWPISPMEGPYEIAGTIGEARGSAGSERFHAGIDIRMDEGTPVRAIREGTVLSPVSTGEFGTLNEWLRVGALTYVHVRAGRNRSHATEVEPGFVASYDPSGRLTRVRVRRGTHYATGDVIASVNAFNHVHLNVGWPGEEVNPLKFRLPQFVDTVAPTIASRGIHLYTEDWQPIRGERRSPPTLVGRIRIVADAWDQVDGNRPNRRLGLYALGYQVLLPDGSPAPGFERETDRLVFDRLAVQPDAARLVYAPGSGIPFYGERRTRFLYVVTNTFRNGVAAEEFWDTGALPPGKYIVRIHARDISGNEAIANRNFAVVVAAR